ncbi:MAG: flagellar hook-length control protein FliK [Candidatus Puniceispirillales bacterium]
MNITSNVNKNFDLLSNLKNEGQDSSLLNTLFSINFENDISSEYNNEKEFIFKEEEVVLINYLSNIIPNFQNENKNLSDLEKIKKQIEIDLNINPELKRNIINFLRKEKFSFKDFNVNFVKKSNINNKESIDHILNKKHLSTNLLKSESTLSNISENYKTNKDQFNISKTFENVDSEKQINKPNHYVKIENTQFVKKIKKNNHPNKIYQLPQSNASKYKQLNDITSGIDQKQINNDNLNINNNQVSEGPKNTKVNEIKMNNNQTSNVQQLVQSNNNNGNNFSQQNDSSFTNSSYNSVLENFVDNLDLTQKGWTTKLASRIENALLNGGEEIQFNLKPKNLGVLKVSVKLKNGIGNVKIITENSFVTSALNQSESYLQKLFNEQGVNLDFTAQNESQQFSSRNHFNQNSNNGNEKKSLKSDSDIIKTSEEKIDITTENNSSRHIINVIA